MNLCKFELVVDRDNELQGFFLNIDTDNPKRWIDDTVRYIARDLIDSDKVVLKDDAGQIIRINVSNSNSVRIMLRDVAHKL